MGKKKPKGKPRPKPYCRDGFATAGGRAMAAIVPLLRWSSTECAINGGRSR
jgi:hypothetical protein